MANAKCDVEYYRDAGEVNLGNDWKDGLVVRGTGCSSRGPGSSPSTYVAANCHLELQFQGS